MHELYIAGAAARRGRMMAKWARPFQASLRRWWWLLLIILLLGSYWLLPITGQVVVSSNAELARPLWPQMSISPANPQLGDKVTVAVTDNRPWTNVVLTIDGQPARFDHWQKHTELDAWTWMWTFAMPAPGSTRSRAEVLFYTDCQTGCQARGRLFLGQSTNESSVTTFALGQPTKLCVAFADPARDWKGRNGWVVDITYAQLADDQKDTYWTVNELAARVHAATAKGLRVLVRVDYDRGQSVPPANDFLALNAYLAYLRRLARDERLQSVVGFIIGSGFNARDSNMLAPDHPVTPAWYARIFNGYGEPVEHIDNGVQTIRSENMNLRVFVGPVRPWISDQTGSQRYKINVPWLNYMNSLVNRLDEGARAKAQAGFALAAPDGFAVNASGHPDAPELQGRNAAEEPRLSLPRADWNGAQAGFQVYQDWLNIINAYTMIRGLPVYINATNTLAPDGAPPAQNYPQGWLTAALDVINAEPQVQSLCWFLDLVPGDSRWDAFSLTRKPGRLIYAAEEFDALLSSRETK
jgi:hypothetical protein